MHDLIPAGAGLFLAVLAALHFTGIAVVLIRFRRPPEMEPEEAGAEGISIIRPLCGLENFIEETLRSTFHLNHPNHEILFCVSHGNDAVVPIVHRLIAEHPGVDAKLLIGDSGVSANPKLNNMHKAWDAARHDWILIADSNVLMPADHIQRMKTVWEPDTGVVCSPPAGFVPRNFWAEVEAGFLNTYQARWQCLADSLGYGFTQGKSMLCRRAVLEAGGGFGALARETAEDAAATKIVRELGLKVRLVTEPLPQPLGFRRWSDVWRRQVRWARLRRGTFPLWFLPEVFAGSLWALAAAGLAWAATGHAAVVPILAVAWYGAEAVLAHVAGWPLTWRSVAAWAVRDALLPALWVAAWAGDDFEWRGNAMTLAGQGTSP